MFAVDKDTGLRARHVQLSWASLVRLGDAYPVMAELENGNWVVVVGAASSMSDGSEVVKILDPLAQRSELLLVSEAQFMKKWRGSVVLLKRQYRLAESDQPFGFRWFVPELLRQRHL